MPLAVGMSCLLAAGSGCKEGAEETNAGTPEPPGARLLGYWKVDLDRIAKYDSSATGKGKRELQQLFGRDWYHVEPGRITAHRSMGSLATAYRVESDAGQDIVLITKARGGKEQRKPVEVVDKDRITITTVSAKGKTTRMPLVRTTKPTARDQAAGPVTGDHPAVLAAKTRLRRLQRAAATYFQSSTRGRTGSAAVCQFPASTAWTPPGDDNCRLPQRRFPRAPTFWSRPTWSALSFRVEGPSAFQFSVESSGEMGAARITFTARGDHDCDGKQTVLRASVSGAAKSNATACVPEKYDPPFVVSGASKGGVQGGLPGTHPH